MNLSELINEILSEWAYRCDDGMPNPKNPIHLKELGDVLSEMGLSHIKNTLVENLLMEKGKTPEPVKEEEGSFSNPVLNKKIKYKNAKGEDAEGIVGNLLRLPAEHPGRKAAEALLPADGTPERDKMNQDLGGQGQAGGAEKPKDDKGDEEPKADGGGEEDKAKAAQAMFDPKADPAMAARLDKEKEVQAQLAKDAEADKETEKVKEPKEDGEFNPIDSKDVAKEMPQADPDTFAGGSDIPDGVTPEELDKFNTDISKVAQQIADAKAKGEQAPNINLCDVTVPGTNLYCDDNLGIPRDEMPQFKGTAQPGSRAAGMEADASGEVDTEPVFKEMLKEKGIKTLQTEIPADKLKATQKDLVGAKVIGMMGALEKDPNHPKITAPIYVSRDGHVIDGHHRWAAIVAYNAAHPDAQIPMKTTVLDMDIKDAIPMANKFAEDMGIAAKKADANKEDVVEPKAAEVKPNETDPTSNVKTFKGESSGKEVKTVELEGGGFLFGTQHGDTKMADDIINQVKATIPKEKWKDVVFVGEGGATGDSGELEFNDEMEYSAPKFKEMGASIDTWDGDELDVHNDQSDLYKSQEEQTGLSQSKIKAGNWASMIGQGEGTDTMSPNDFLDDEGKEFLQNAAKEAGFPPIENWDNPSEKDKDTLYRLSFPEDNGDKETGVNDVQVAFNKARDLNLIKKQKELAAQGKIPIVMAGESHAELVDDIMKGKEEEPKGTEKLPEPEEPSTEDGGVVYSLGGGYYSDTPKGPAQYRVVESVVEEVLVEGNETFAYLLFEATVTKKTSKGKVVKLKTIDPKKQKAATQNAKAEKKKETGEEGEQQIDIKKLEEIVTDLYGPGGKGPLVQGSATSDAALKNGYTEGEWWVAPGNAGSNFNENMSNEVACILKKHPNLTEEELAWIIFNKTKGTKLGAQQANPAIKSKNKIKVPAGMSKEEAVLYRNAVIAARSGRTKYDRVVEGVEACKKQVKFGEIESVVGYGGTSKKLNTPEKVKTDRENMLAEVDSANNCYIYDNETGKVYLIDKKELKKWIMSSGGGENAADTVVLTKDKNGNLLYDGWSDKKTLGDLQANGTLYNDMIQSGIRVQEMINNGQIDQKDASKAKKIIEDGANEIKLIERGYSTIASSHSKYFLSLSDKEFKKIEELAASNPDTKKHYKNWTDTVNKIANGKGVADAKSVAIAEEISDIKRKKSKEEIAADKFIEDTLDKYGEDTVATLLKNPDIDESIKQQVKKAEDVGKKGRKEYMNWFNTQWLTDKKNKTKIKSLSPFRLLNNVQIKSPNVVSENERKVIDRNAAAERQKYISSKNRIPKTLDTQNALESMRKKAFSVQRGIFENLSKIKAKTTNGTPTTAAAVLGFKDTVASLHLDKITPPKDEKDIHQILKRSTNLVMEGVRVSPKDIKDCLGVDDINDLENNFVVDFTTDKFITNADGNVTGKTIAIYLVDKKGVRREISPKVYRPKTGPTGKTANTLAWADDMQKCFDSKK